MSKYFAIVDGKVLDYRFKNRETDIVFYIGDICLGQIWKIGKSYTAVSLYENPYGPMNGLKTRMDAAGYLLKVFRVVQEREKRKERNAV